MGVGEEVMRIVITEETEAVVVIKLYVGHLLHDVMCIPKAEAQKLHDALSNGCSRKCGCYNTGFYSGYENGLDDGKQDAIETVGEWYTPEPPEY